MIIISNEVNTLKELGMQQKAILDGFLYLLVEVHAHILLEFVVQT